MVIYLDKCDNKIVVVWSQMLPNVVESGIQRTFQLLETPVNLQHRKGHCYCFITSRFRDFWEGFREGFRLLADIWAYKKTSSEQHGNITREDLWHVKIYDTIWCNSRPFTKLNAEETVWGYCIQRLVPFTNIPLVFINCGRRVPLFCKSFDLLQPPNQLFSVFIAHQHYSDS